MLFFSSLSPPVSVIPLKVFLNYEMILSCPFILTWKVLKFQVEVGRKVWALALSDEAGHIVSGGPSAFYSEKVSFSRKNSPNVFLCDFSIPKPWPSRNAFIVVPLCQEPSWFNISEKTFLFSEYERDWLYRCLLT